MIDCQFNVRSRRIEWAGMGPFDDDERWKPITDRKLAELRERIEPQILAAIRQGRAAAEVGPRCLPRHAERACLPPRARPLPRTMAGRAAAVGWFRQTRGDAVQHVRVRMVAAGGMGEHIHLSRRRTERTTRAGRQDRRNSRLDRADQGLGKSALLREAVPPEHAGPCTATGCGGTRATRNKSRPCWAGCSVEVPEMGGRRKAEIEHMKALITRQDDGADPRLAFARNPEPLAAQIRHRGHDQPRRPICRTMSPATADSFPSSCGKDCNVETVDGQGKGEPCGAKRSPMYHAGRRANLPRELFNMQREQAEEHRDRDELLEDAVDGLHGDGPYTLSTILGLLDMKEAAASQNRVARALRNAGWIPRRTKRRGCGRAAKGDG